MAKRKNDKKDVMIKRLGNNDDKLMVQKSRPLYSLWQSKLTLPEFKILDTYLARIDSHKPELRTVVFSKGELEQKLGVKRITTPVLKQRLKNLMTPIEIQDYETPDEFVLVTLFEKAEAVKDQNEQWNVKLTCTESAQKYFFNIDKIGYLRYKLRCITNISSRYTYIMFTYLEANRFRKSWEVELDELKHLLACDEEETYKEYKRFNDRLLKRVHKEMHDKTECRYSYESVKKGRKVVAVRFTLETLSDAKKENESTPIPLAIDPEQQLWEEVIKEFGFTRVQCNEINGYLGIIPDYKLPEVPGAHNIREIRLYHYILNKTNEMKRNDEKKPIKNKYLYLLKSIKNDTLE